MQRDSDEFSASIFDAAGEEVHASRCRETLQRTFRCRYNRVLSGIAGGMQILLAVPAVFMI